MSQRPSRGITLLGLGPGDIGLLTKAAWDELTNAEMIYVRTMKHPVIESLPAQLIVNSFDHLYDVCETFDEVYRQIVEQILELAYEPEGVIYAVPGHPFVAEATSIEISRRAKELHIPVRIIEGLSFIDSVFSLLKIDPLPKTAIIDSHDIINKQTPNFSPNLGAVIPQVYSKEVASDVKLTLLANYPDEHQVSLIHSAGTSQALVESLKLFEIDRSPHIGLLTCLYVPPMDEKYSFEDFVEVIARLRAPDGCPWDKNQTHKSLRPYLLEETYEVLASIDSENPEGMREEFGDLLLQIILHAQIAAEEGEFSIRDILHDINKKIVQRHPHVFSGQEISDEIGVLSNWERLKAVERNENGKEKSSLLDGVATALPALVQADQYQKRAARVGFDWPDIDGVLDKLREEFQEVLTEQDQRNRAKEVGDLLFAVANLARWYDIDPESALRESNRRFKDRFYYIEESARLNGRMIDEMSLEEMEKLWQEAKKFIK
jgi:tetrapyrrole methylase family protein/MazG family protein